MEDYYYENNIVPPNIHFKKPFWLKEDKKESNDKDTNSYDKFEEKHDKLPTPSDIADIVLTKVPFQEDEIKDKMIIVREDLKNNIRNEKERGGRKRRSLSTSFSFLSENRRGIEMDSFVGKQSNIVENIIQELDHQESREDSTRHGFEGNTPSTLNVPKAIEGMSRHMACYLTPYSL